MSLSIIILAAGQGTRMYSDKPKVLHQLAGKSLLEHVHHTASMLDTRGIHVVYGYGGDQLIEDLSHLSVDWVEQNEQLGTGHAVKQALPNIPDKDQV
ncbi:MAG: NTP transferase domain-containing protein, partial [Proteobacteria bacterium]|nr:NTP transferase domain-containing protein [Pseudomonadota bacterium]